jgi:hypothetical protein
MSWIKIRFCFERCWLESKRWHASEDKYSSYAHPQTENSAVLVSNLSFGRHNIIVSLHFNKKLV